MATPLSFQDERSFDDQADLAAVRFHLWDRSPEARENLSDEDFQSYLQWKVATHRPAKGFRETIATTEYGEPAGLGDVTPFVETFKTMSGWKETLDLAKKVDIGKATEAERDEFMRRAQYISRPSDWTGIAGSILRQAPALAGEMAIGAKGAGFVAKKAAGKAAQEFIEATAEKVMLRQMLPELGKAAGRGAAIAAFNESVTLGSGVRAAAYQRMYQSMGADVSETEAGDLSVQFLGDAKNFLEVLPASIVDTLVEPISERSGRALTAPLAKVQGLMGSVSAQWMKKTGKDATQFSKALQKIGWDGILEESIEERYAGLLRAGAGVALPEDFEGWDEVFPGWEQFAGELAGFAVMGGAYRGIGAAGERMGLRPFVPEDTRIIDERVPITGPAEYVPGTWETPDAPGWNPEDAAREARVEAVRQFEEQGLPRAEVQQRADEAVEELRALWVEAGVMEQPSAVEGAEVAEGVRARPEAPRVIKPETLQEEPSELREEEEAAPEEVRPAAEVAPRPADLARLAREEGRDPEAYEEVGPQTEEHRATERLRAERVAAGASPMKVRWVRGMASQGAFLRPGEVFINVDAPDAARVVLAHEWAHELVRLTGGTARGHWIALMRRMRREDPYGWRLAREKHRKDWISQQGLQDDADGRQAYRAAFPRGVKAEEAFATHAGILVGYTEMLQSPEGRRHMVRVARKSPGLWQTIKDWISAAWSRATGRPTADAEFREFARARGVDFGKGGPRKEGIIAAMMLEETITAETAVRPARVEAEAAPEAAPAVAPEAAPEAAPEVAPAVAPEVVPEAVTGPAQVPAAEPEPVPERPTRAPRPGGRAAARRALKEEGDVVRLPDGRIGTVRDVTGPEGAQRIRVQTGEVRELPPAPGVEGQTFAPATARGRAAGAPAEVVLDANQAELLERPGVPRGRMAQRRYERAERERLDPTSAARFAPWHGTGATFDRFSTEFMGTGEGAQAYGWGLYFASKRAVAEHYRNPQMDPEEIRVGGEKWDPRSEGERLALERLRFESPGVKPNRAVELAIESVRGDVARAQEFGDFDAFRAASDELSALQRFQELGVTYGPRGHLLRVDLAPKEEDYLLWDRPLSEQSEKVREALRGVQGGRLFSDSLQPFEDTSGSGLYLALSQDLQPELEVPEGIKGWTVIQRGDEGQKAASQALLAAGIRGIKYLDGTSRAAGEGSYNYVIFDAADAQITARFAPAPPVDSPEFRAWFGDSKVVGDDGEPLVVYHGTASDTDGPFAFSSSAIGSAHDAGYYGRGFYFARTRGEAAYYGPNVIEAYLSIQSPLDLTNRSGDLTARGHFSSWHPKLRALGVTTKETDQAFDQLQELMTLVREKAEVYALNDSRRGLSGWGARLSYESPSDGETYEVDSGTDFGRPFNSKKRAIEALEHQTIAEFRTHHGYDLEFPSLSDYVRTQLGGGGLTQAAEAAGHDGVFYGDEFVAFSPTQIKSATGNVGAYGQRPLTAEEAARFGMTEAEALEAQQAGDIRFAPAPIRLSEYGLSATDRAGRYQLHEVDVAALDLALQDEESSYVGPGGTGAAIKDRYQRFEKWLRGEQVGRVPGRAEGQMIEAPTVRVTETGVSLDNGRHRFAVLRDQGQPVMGAFAPSEVPAARAAGIIPTGAVRFAPTPPSRREDLPERVQAARARGPVGKQRGVEVALTTDEQEQAEVQKAVDEALEGTGFWSTVTDDDMREMQRRARRTVESDPKRVASELIKKHREGETLNTQETFQLRYLTHSSAKLALNMEDELAWKQVYALHLAYRESGRELSRAMRARKQVFNEEVMGEELMALILARPTLKAADKIDQLIRERRDLATTDARRAEIDAEIDSILGKEASKNAKVYKALRKMGVDPASITKYDWQDDYQRAKLIHTVTAARADMVDKARELLYASMLSGFATHLRNFRGNAVNLALSKYLQDTIEASINLVARDPDSPTFGEFKYMAPSFKEAGRRFLKAFITQMPEDLEALEGDTTKLGEGVRGRAIASPLFRPLRAVSLDPLLAADEAFKGLIGPTVRAQYAYREARKEGLKPGEALDRRVQELMEDPTILARAREEELRLTFQDDAKEGTILHAVEGGANSFRKALDNVIPLAGTIHFPFVKTPLRLMREGLRRSPLTLATYTAKVAGSAHKGYRGGRRALVRDTADAIISALLFWGIMSILDDEDEQGVPVLTGAPADDYGELQLQYRTAAPYTVSLLGQRFSYKQMDPVMLGVATTLDTARAMRNALEIGNTEAATAAFQSLSNSIGKAATDATYLRTIGDVMELQKRASEMTIGNFAFRTYAQPWIPNVVRHNVRALDPYLRESRVRKFEGMDGLDPVLKRVPYSLLPARNLAPPPKQDIWGRDIVKDSSPLSSSVWARMFPVFEQMAAGGPAMKYDAALLRLKDRIDRGEVDAKWSPPRAHPYHFQHNKENKYWSDSEYHEFVKLSGQRALFLLDDQDLNLEEPGQAELDAIKSALSAGRKYAKEILLERRGL